MSTLAKNRNEMKVEREIAGFAFPFAAGVAASVTFGAFPHTIRPSYHIVTSAVILLSAVLLMYSFRKGWKYEIQWGLIGVCFLACGALVGLSGNEMQVSGTRSFTWLGMAEKALARITGLIDSIPFAHEQTGGLIKALLTGDRSEIPPEIKQAFQDSGASHILALSGLHLGIIYALIVKVLSAAGNSPAIRRIQSVMTILICGFYTMATGAGASIMRAFIFITINEVGKMTGRHTSLKSVLAVSLMIHLIFAPTAVSEIGFQLSYAAIFGIAYIFPWMRRMWKNNWAGLKWMWESLALSISCQITTGPLAYLYFGTFPQYFLLTNLIAVPLAGLIIPSALITLILTATGWCPEFLIHVTEWLVRAMTDSLNIIATM